MIWALVRRDTLALARSERRLARSLDALPDAVVVAEPSGRILYVNRAARGLLGLAGPDTLRDLEDYRTRWQLRYADGRPVPADDLVLARALRGEPSSRDSLLRRGDGRDRLVTIVGAPVREDGEGPPSVAVAVLHDVTELRHLEAMRDEFLSTAAHELKTPVATIKGYVQLLQRWRDGNLAVREASALDVLERQCDRLNRIVQDLLQVSRQPHGGAPLSPRRFDLGELAEDVATRLGTILKRRIVVERGGPAPVLADRDRIDQVLANLLDNAVKFSPGGEPVEVFVGTRPGEAVVSIRDRGIGIPAANRERIFERYYRAHAGTGRDYGGLGIGLHLGRQAVVRHGGRIWFESLEGKGTTFHVALPLAPEDPDGR
jgi:PAS domain S-box-containing protein